MTGTELETHCCGKPWTWTIEKSNHSLFWAVLGLFSPPCMPLMGPQTLYGPLPLHSHQMTGTRNKTRHLRNFCGSMREKSKNGPVRAVFTINCPAGMPLIGPPLLYEPLPLRPHQLVGTRMNNRHFGGFCAWMRRKSNYLGFFLGGSLPLFLPPRDAHHGTFTPQWTHTTPPTPDDRDQNRNSLRWQTFHINEREMQLQPFLGHQTYHVYATFHHFTFIDFQTLWVKNDLH